MNLFECNIGYTAAWGSQRYNFLAIIIFAMNQIYLTDVSLHSIYYKL